MLDESTFERLTIHGAVAPVVQRLLLSDPQFVPGLEALAVNRQREDDSLQRIERGARLLHRGRRAAVQATRVAGVGGGLGGRQIGAGPLAAVALLARVLFRSLFRRANRCFDGPIMPRTRRR
ncbi:MAG TPA: hypothetical protein VG013_08270 [Gemmataceae bacterium]|nr:hypothetical protein [Gemmataceae bacterium]